MRLTAFDFVQKHLLTTEFREICFLTSELYALNPKDLIWVDFRPDYVVIQLDARLTQLGFKIEDNKITQVSVNNLAFTGYDLFIINPAKSFQVKILDNDITEFKSVFLEHIQKCSTPSIHALIDALGSQHVIS